MRHTEADWMDRPTNMLSLYEDSALAAAGLVIDSPGLPYSPMPTPTYRVVDAGTWKLHQPFICAAPGYFTPPRPLSWVNTILFRDGIAWMSLTPIEIESQMPHLAASHGVVVVCGLGLGVMAYAVSALRAVTRVIVIERDSEVIAAFRQFTDFETWPQRAKVEIIEGDAREVRVDGVDFLYADIWPFYRMDCMIPDMQAIHRNIPAPACGYWGQELDMVDEAVARGVTVDDFGADHIRDFASRHRLPLIGLEQPDYPRLCRMAATNPAISIRRKEVATPARAS